MLAAIVDLTLRVRKSHHAERDAYYVAQSS